MRKLFTESQVLFGELAEEIPNHAAVVRAGGRADIQHALYIQKHRGNGRFCGDAYVHYRSGRAGISGGEGLTRTCFGENIAITPDVLLNDQNASRQHEPDRFRRIAGTHQKRVLWEILLFGAKAGEHCAELLLRNTRKER